MDIALEYRSEGQAAKAENLPEFGGLNLLHIKREVAELISRIGSSGIFDEYTKHDISHINAMLNLLESQIIPPRTFAAMSTADWLLLVLSVYFHDLGMLVTKHEYANRFVSGFPHYRDTVLFSKDDAGKDYRVRVSSLTGDDEERFLYQEFVRAHHAQRIRSWIEGSAPQELGITDSVAAALETLLNCLPTDFRRDLGIMCESHHLDDLDDLRKYNTSRPYGMTPSLTANLQYVAVLLRTADLLHITSDRTPSIAFRVLNPSDPLSQREWAKQRAVTSIRVRPERNQDDTIDHSIQSNTFEVYATFTDEEGFFGLTSYLDYAEKQLDQSFKWVAQAQKTETFPHSFPWRHIDQRHIETKNFLREQFEFTIDQVRILDLLTGHTLYNDPDVVVRELAQNSIDAVRLQFFDPTRSLSQKEGLVRIDWNSNEQILTITDNGTGMSQEIIQNNLLKIGASRYQEPRFREEHPDFSPISRFGIGILSAFMIADAVEITTVYQTDEQARRLLLRSVHGKYLIRLIDKSDHSLNEIGEHGTKVQLKLRPSAKLDNIEEIARGWIVIPGCKVVVRVNGGEEIVIGHSSPRKALEWSLKKRGISVTTQDIDSKDVVRVHEWTGAGVTLAYATVWSEYFRERSFMYWQREYESGDDRHGAIGTCVEGIRITSASPGYQGRHLCAVANATGESAPRTNVARSGLENTPQRDQLLRQIYDGFAAHVSNEVKALQGARGYSLTHAASVASYLIAPIVPERISPDEGPIDVRLLREALSEIPAIVVEEHGNRTAKSVSEIAASSDFWTIDCEFFRTVNQLLYELPNSVSLETITTLTGGSRFSVPSGVVVFFQNLESILGRLLLSKREVKEIRVDREEKRIDLRWGTRTNPPMWLDPDRDWPPMNSSIRRAMEDDFRYGRQRHDPDVLLARSDEIVFRGLSDEIAVESSGIIYLLPGSPLCACLREQCLRNSNYDALHLLLEFIGRMMASDVSPERASTELRDWLLPRARPHVRIEDSINVDDVLIAIAKSKFRSFSTRRWRRNTELY